MSGHKYTLKPAIFMAANKVSEEAYYKAKRNGFKGGFATLKNRVL